MNVPYESARNRVGEIMGRVFSGAHEFLVNDWENAEFWAALADDPAVLVEFVRDLLSALIAATNDLAVMVDDLYDRTVPNN